MKTTLLIIGIAILCGCTQKVPDAILTRIDTLEKEIRILDSTCADLLEIAKLQAKQAEKQAALNLAASNSMSSIVSTQGAIAEKVIDLYEHYNSYKY